MNRVLVWVLALQFTTGHNLLAELVRTPSLLDHYQIHLRETPDLSFAGFIWLHYCNTRHEQSDTRHGDLPLHCCSHGVVVESVVHQVPALSLLPNQEEPFRKRQIPENDESILPDDFESGLFRPPLA